MADEVGKLMRSFGFKATWRPLTPRKGGKSFTSRSEALDRAKRYRKLQPKKKFKIEPNYDKSLFAVSIREWIK